MPRVNIDYHVELDRHYYSVPYQTGRQARRGSAAPSIDRSRSSPRANTSPPTCAAVSGGATRPIPRTCPSRTAATRSGRRLASSPGRRRPVPRTAELVEEILASRPHPEQGFRSALGIIRLGEASRQDRVEAACERALALRAYSYRSVESILEHDLDRQPLRGEALPRPHPRHRNVRGANYYR